MAFMTEPAISGKENTCFMSFSVVIFLSRYIDDNSSESCDPLEGIQNTQGINDRLRAKNRTHFCSGPERSKFLHLIVTHTLP